jgi:hypothetical protein
MTKCVRARGAARQQVAGLLVVAALAACGGGGGDDRDGGPCPSGQSLCSEVCTNTRLDPQHCGTCTIACATGEVCASGTCATECPPGLTGCGGGCTNTTFDPQHCGNCATVCADGKVCANGTCAVSCPPGLTDCDGSCTDVNRDPQHCGSCTNSCNTGETCATGTCVLLCPPGQTNCTGVCTNTKIDPQHCGACTTACDAGEVCVDGQCASFCGGGTSWCASAGLCADLASDKAHCGACGTVCTGTLGCHYGRCSAPRGDGIVDSWGELWDAFQRPAATWADATAACAAAGGRLPTVTELYRVNATAPGTGELSDTTATAPLWTQIPWDGTTPTPLYAAVRLSDGVVSAPAMTATVAYRCVWPDATDAFFGPNACHGPPGATCTVAAGRPGSNFDAWERPPVSYLAATAECGLLHARMPLQIELVEGITGTPSLSGGSNNWLWTADSGRYDYVQLVRWTGAEPTTYADVSPYVALGIRGTGPYRFRCTGPGRDTGTHPATVVGEFVAPTTRLKGESTDRAAATLQASVSTCFDAGGHVPTVRDFVELIDAGLPGGSNSPLWTADATSYRYNEIISWTATKPAFAAVYPGEAAWSDRGATTRLSRCVYLPVDASYTAPAATACNGGCFSIATGPVTTWSDTFDRSPATYVEALKACVAAGGHLTSFRDLFELVRAGLPNGSNTFLWTSDAAGGEAGAGAPPAGDPAYTLQARWTAVAVGFDGTNPTYTTHATKVVGTTAPYRCGWTNEYR